MKKRLKRLQLMPHKLKHVVTHPSPVFASGCIIFFKRPRPHQ